MHTQAGTMFTATELKRMDRTGKTHELMMGFVRSIVSLIDSDEPLFHVIPDEVVYLCTAYSVITIHLRNWDTMERERWQALNAIYYRHASAAMLVFDVTDRNSFEHLRKWHDGLMTFADMKDIVTVVVANKTDLNEERTVNDEEIRKYAESIQADVAWTSAKTDYNIQPLFRDIVHKVLDNSSFYTMINGEITLKAITLGDFGVGKSSIIKSGGATIKKGWYYTEKVEYITLPLEHSPVIDSAIWYCDPRKESEPLFAAMWRGCKDMLQIASVMALGIVLSLSMAVALTSVISKSTSRR